MLHFSAGQLEHLFFQKRLILYFQNYLFNILMESKYFYALIPIRSPSTFASTLKPDPLIYC